MTTARESAVSSDNGYARQPRLLSIEDQPETIQGTLASLRFQGCYVETVDELSLADRSVRENHYDLLLVDQKLPRQGEYRDEGGVELVVELQERGALGPLNQKSRFVFVTADRSWITEARVTNLPGYLGIEAKTGSLTSRLLSYCEEVCPGWQPADTRGRPGESRYDTLIVVRRPFSAETSELVEFDVPGWGHDEAGTLEFAHLPDEIQEELSAGYRPVYLFASVNLAATTARELRPEGLRLGPRLLEGETVDSFSDS